MKNPNKYIKPKAFVISTPELMEVGGNAGTSNPDNDYSHTAKETLWQDSNDDIWSESNQETPWSEQ